MLTLELIGLLLAAWKAPGWVREIGLLGLMTGILYNLFGFYNAFHVLAATDGDIAPMVWFAGLKIACITIIYGGLIYVLSLVIRIVQKPRLL